MKFQMNPNIKKRLLRTALLSAVAFAIGGGMALMEIRGQNAQVVNIGPQTGEQQVPGAQIGGPFTLIDQDGKTVTEKDFAGTYKIVYFGFTFCPMICPTELQKIAEVLNMLGAESEQIKPLFITVDPARDTPDVMKSYVVQFHPRMIGLTGSAEQIEAVEKNYRVFAKQAQDESLAEYTMDHSSFIYLMGPDDTLVAIYRTADTANFIAADIKNKLAL